MNEHFFIYNGKPLGESASFIGPQHPGLLHGDGLFETMRMHKGTILNQRLHEERLRHGCGVLGYEVTEETFKKLFEDAQSTFSHLPLPNLRIRLSVFRSNSVFNREADRGIDYLIQAMPTTAPEFQSDGLTAIIYKDLAKDRGRLSNLKHSSYLLHTQAHRAARESGNQEAIILNSDSRVCEASIANIFFVEDDCIFTPALSEGCVAGTIRRWLIQNRDKTGIDIVETTCSIARLLSADEVFITNSIRWVVPLRGIEDRRYSIDYSRSVFEQIERHLA